jgi:hypothetical protein
VSWADVKADMEQKVMDTFETEGVYTPYEGQGYTISVDINETSTKMGDKEDGVMRFVETTATVYRDEVPEVNNGDKLVVGGQEYRVEFITHTTDTTYVIQLTKR